MKWVKRIAVGFIACLLVIVLGANAYWAIGRSGVVEDMQPPGRMVNIGTHSLHIYCEGEGSPTVVLEAGGFGLAADWGSVFEQAQGITRICAYDRAGLGWSEPGLELPRFENVSAELARLLEAAGEKPPYILAGQSNGFSFVWSFAEAYPEDVVGLISVDGVPPTILEVQATTGGESPIPSWLPILERIGVLRLSSVGASSDLGGHGYPQWALDTHAQSAFLSSQFLTDVMMVADVSDYMAQVDSLGDLPLIVIATDTKLGHPINDTTENPDETWAAWRRGQDLAASFSTAGEVRVAEGASHFLQKDRPDVVASAIADMVADQKRNSED